MDAEEIRQAYMSESHIGRKQIHTYIYKTDRPARNENDSLQAGRSQANKYKFIPRTSYQSPSCSSLPLQSVSVSAYSSVRHAPC